MSSPIADCEIPASLDDFKNIPINFARAETVKPRQGLLKSQNSLIRDFRRETGKLMRPVGGPGFPF